MRVLRAIGRWLGRIWYRLRWGRKRPAVGERVWFKSRPMTIGVAGPETVWFHDHLASVSCGRRTLHWHDEWQCWVWPSREGTLIPEKRVG